MSRRIYACQFKTEIGVFLLPRPKRALTKHLEDSAIRSACLPSCGIHLDCICWAHGLHILRPSLEQRLHPQHYLCGSTEAAYGLWGICCNRVLMLPTHSCPALVYFQFIYVHNRGNMKPTSVGFDDYTRELNQSKHFVLGLVQRGPSVVSYCFCLLLFVLSPRTR